MNWTVDAFIWLVAMFAIYFLWCDARRTWALKLPRLWMVAFLLVLPMLPIAWLSFTHETLDKILLWPVLCRAAALSGALTSLMLCLACSRGTGVLSRISRQWLKCSLKNP
jgi:hypothetical protein